MINNVSTIDHYTERKLLRERRRHIEPATASLRLSDLTPLHLGLNTRAIETDISLPRSTDIAGNSRF